jgi:DNA primase
MVPIATPSLKIVGFILRGTSTKEYRTVFDYVDIPPMFGFEDFKDFKTNKPIILCEGVKDAIYLKTHYKHTLSLNTSSISVINLEILSKLTNYLILAYDNDSVGVASSLDDRDMLIKNGFTCEIITPTQKDCAEFIENKTGENDFIYSLRQKLKYLGGEYGIN